MPEDQTFVALRSPDGQLSLDLCPSIGGGIAAFRKHDGGKTVDLFRAYDPALRLSPLNFSSFPLVPFSNRIGYGKLSFQGATYKIGPPFGNEPHPNHGDGWTSPWTVQEAGSNSAILILTTRQSADMPYMYVARQVFTLQNDALLIDISVTNALDMAMPFGIGHHPYFNRTDQTILKAGLRKVWTSVNMLPDKLTDIPAKWNFNKGVVLSRQNLEPARYGSDGSAYIDHCFCGWIGVAEIIWPEQATRLVMTADKVFGNFVIYIPSKGNFFCAEPVTNVTDGFNLMDSGVKETGTVILKPGETLSGRVRFDVRTA